MTLIIGESLCQRQAYIAKLDLLKGTLPFSGISKLGYLIIGSPDAFFANMGDNDGEQASYDQIAAQLKQWVSPKAGTISDMEVDGGASDGYGYGEMGRSSMGNDEIDAMSWMQREIHGDSPMPSRPSTIGRGRSRSTASSASGGYSSTPKRTPLLERASTPVMSNSSSKKRGSRSLIPTTAAATPGEMDLDEPPAPIETPAPKASSRNRLPPSSHRSPMSEEGGEMEDFSSTFLLESSSKQFRRYHDAMLAYLRARRSISNRIDLEHQERSLIEQADPGMGAISASSTSFSLADQECATERQFLLTLNRAAWSGAVASSSGLEEQSRRQEGNLWMLLHMLRQLGLASLIWANDQTSNMQNAKAQEVYLQQLAGQIESTPRDLIQTLSTSPSTKSMANANSPAPPPLLTQRRYQILKWLELCHDEILSAPPKPSSVPTFGNSSSKAHPDDTAPSLVGESNSSEEKLLESCLSHLLAGKLDQAMEIARAHGQPWRSASWSGGAPAGVESRPNERTKTMEKLPVGNPGRFLWKRQMWKSGQSIASKSPAAAAMSSILANDVHTAIQNPCLRSWEKCMYTTFFGMWGRMEDQLLNFHNNNRRRAAPSAYPGIMHTRQEQEQLSATSELKEMTEHDVVQMLLASPFDVVRGTGTYEAATSAVLIGASAIAKYCDAETNAHVERFQGNGGTSYYDMGGDESLSPEEREEELARLRFLTHLALYLDSLSASTTPMILPGIEDQKNKLLLQYVKYLASRPDMWHLVVLYASLLPEETMLSFLPEVLTQVTDFSERKAMLEQMRDLLQPAGSELPVLRRAVRLLLAPSEEGNDVSDEEKCSAIEWMLQYDEHLGDALICANMLLRDFFLSEDDDKISSAILLVEEYLPGDLLDRAGEDHVEKASDVEEARAEYRAFLSYLDAYNEFVAWKDVISKVDHSFTGQEAGDSSTELGPDAGVTEKVIAQQHILSKWIRQKSDNSERVMAAANEARKALHNVLTHSGAWLWHNESEAELSGEEMVVSNTNSYYIEEERRRRNGEISDIRKRYLVLAVNFYHQVCEETAAWMSRSLDDNHGIPILVGPGQSRRRVALAKISNSNEIDLSAIPLCPSYWYQHALDLATLVANDEEHKILQAFGSSELQEFLSKLAETAVSKLMDAA